MDDFMPIHMVADFATLVGTYAKGFAIIIEPYDDRLPSVPDPVIQVSRCPAEMQTHCREQRWVSFLSMRMRACCQSCVMDRKVHCSLSPHHVHHGFRPVFGLRLACMKDRD